MEEEEEEGEEEEITATVLQSQQAPVHLAFRMVPASGNWEEISIKELNLEENKCRSDIVGCVRCVITCLEVWFPFYPAAPLVSVSALFILFLMLGID